MMFLQTRRLRISTLSMTLVRALAVMLGANIGTTRSCKSYPSTSLRSHPPSS
jgi:hypothetical protein